MAVWNTSHVMLYQPDHELQARLPDIAPLVAYMNGIKSELASFWSARAQPASDGMLIAAGVKPDRSTRVWVDAINGAIPDDELSAFSAHLEDLACAAELSGSVAFAIVVAAPGRQVPQQTMIPAAWRAAAQTASKGPLSVPDGIFALLWPDE